MKIACLSALAFLSVSTLSAAPGDLDQAFLNQIGAGITGSGYPERFPNGAVQAMGIQPDGKILLGSGGGMSRYNNAGVLTALKRLNADGSLDAGFAPNTAFENGPHTLAPGEGSEVNVILVNPDGSFYIGGVFANYGPGSAVRSCLAKINADGTLDENFVPPALGGGQRYVQSLALDGKGGLLVGGTFFITGRNNMIRLNAETGAIDPGFTLFSPMSYPATVDSISLGADGRVYISGISTTSRPCAFRLLEDGSVDNSFAVPFTNDFGRVNKILPLPDGRVLIGGTYSLLGGPGTEFLNATDINGALDATFTTNLGTGTNGWVGGVLQLLPDGRILAGGIFNEHNGTPIASLMILGTDGVRDTSFTVAPYSDDREDYLTHFYAAGVQPDGKIVAGGWFERITDPGFDIRNLVRFEGTAAAGAGALRFVSASYSALENAGSVTVQVARLPGVSGAVSVNFATGGGAGTAVAGTDYTSTSGTLNWADGEGGVKSITIPLINNSAAAAAKTFRVALSAATGGAVIASVGETLVTILDDDALPTIVTPPANVTLNQGGLLSLRVTAASPLPLTYQWQFDNGSGFQNLLAQTMPSLLIGQVTPAAHAGQYRVIVSNANGPVQSAVATVIVNVPAGSVMPEFSVSIPNPVVKAVQDAQGRYLLATNGTNTVIRRNADGSVDSGFTAPVFDGSITSLLSLPDGKVLVSGFFQNVGGVARRGVARLNANGTLDESLNLGLTLAVNHVAAGAGGKFYVGFTNGSGNGLRRYNADGTLDSGFTATNIGTGVSNGYVWAVKERGDGTLFVAHQVGTSGTVYAFSRLNVSDGSVVPGFTHGTMNWNVYDWDFLPDGRIIIAGRFTTIGGVTRNRIAILNANGSLDTSFDAGVGPFGPVLGVKFFQGRIFAWGEFTQVNGIAQRGIARFNLDGSSDASFIVGTAANNSINAFFLLPGGPIHIFGQFTMFNGVTKNYAAALVLGPGSAGFEPARITAIEGAVTVPLTLRRYGSAAGEASIAYATADGTAVADTDYISASGTVTWADGDVADKTVNITLVDNALVQSTRTFTVQLSDATGDIMPAANATITVLDNDTPVTFTIQPAGSSLIAGGTLTLNAAATSPTNIAYQWLLNGVPVSGATSASYSKTGVAVADAGVYQLQATNAAGSFLSNAALVVVQAPSSNLAGNWPTNLTINLNGNPSTGAVRAVLPTSDGGAYIGGEFTNFNGVNGYSHLVKITSFGTVDTNFNPAPNGQIEKLALHDGKLYAIGQFSQIGGGAAYNSTGTSKFAALDAATGARLNSFMSNLTTAPAGSQTTFRALTVLSDGDVLIGGDFIQFNGSNNHKYLARLNPDGTLDAGFNTSYLGQISSASNVVQALAATADGGFYTGGNNLRASGGGNTRERFVKFNADGSFDASFSASAVATVAFSRIRLLPDGQLMASGNNLPGPSGNTRRLSRFTSTGAVDSTFSGPTANTYNDFVNMPDGRTLAIGSGIFFGSTSNVVMFNANGSVAGTWPSGTGFTGVPLVSELASSGEIWIGGEFTAYNGTPVQRLLRLVGTPRDPAIVNAPTPQAFNPGATAFLSVGAAGTGLSYKWFKDGVELEDGGRISGATSALLTIANVTTGDDDLYHVEVTGGTPSNTVASAPVRLRVLGAPEIATQLADQTPVLGSTLTLAPEVYAADPATYVWKRNGVTLVNGGRYSGANTAALTIAGVNATDNGVYTLTITNSQGSITTAPANVTADAFVAAARDPATGWVRAQNTNTQINAILHLPDGRTLIGSTASSAGGGVLDSNGTVNSSGLVLVSPNGQISSTAAGGFARQVNVVIPIPGGKYLIAGSFSAVNGGNARNAVRLNADFSRDNSFTVPETNAVFDVAHADAQGRVYVGGFFNNYNGQTGYSHFIRFNTDGTLDTSFNAVLNGAVQAIVTLPDGRFYVGGNFTTHSSLSIPVPGLLRFLPDGRVDASFEAASLPIGRPNALAVDSLGRIVVGTASGVRRLLPDGSIDPSFTGTVSLNNGVRALYPQPDGKILVGGFFTTPANRFLRLNADGTLDGAFDIGTGFTTSGSVNVIAPDAIGRLWLSGTGFTAYKGVANSAQGFAILQNEAPTLGFTRLPTATRADFGETITLTAAATGNNGFSYRWLKNGVPLSDGPGVSGAHTATLTLTGVTAATAGSYSVRITGPGGTVTSPATPVDVGPVIVPPTLTSSPGDATRDLGGTVTFTVGAKGALPLSFEWFHFDTPLANGTSAGATITGATTPSLTITGLTFAQAGDYRVRVTNPDGTITTQPAVLTIERRPGALAPGIVPSFNSSVRAIHVYADGSYLVGGNFSNVTINGVTTSRGRLARFLPNGALDTTFAPIFNSSVNCIAVDNAGRIYVGGTFTDITLDGVTTNVTRVARLTSALTLDTAFNTVTGSGVFRGPNNEVLTLAPVGDGSVYIGGKFTGIGTGAAVDTSAKYNRMARLKADGSAETAFTSGATNDVNTILRLPNGTLYIGGSSNGWPAGNVARLVKTNANGVRDNDFESPGIFIIVNQVIQLSDGSLFVGGNEFGQPYLKRLNATTGADLGFSITGHVSQVNTVAAEAGGRLLSGALGSFIRMDNDFVRDESLTVNFGSQQILTITAAQDGRIFVGGNFSTVNGVNQGHLAILNGGEFESRNGALAGQTITFASIPDSTFNPAANTFTLPPATSSAGLPVTVTVTSGPATLTGNTVTITGAGEVTLTATAAGNEDFSAATPVVRTFTVAKAAQTLTFGPLPSRTPGAAAFNLSATASSGLPVTYSLISGPANVTGNTVTLTGTEGTVIIQATQAGNADWSAATPVQQSFSVAKSNQVISFGTLPNRSTASAPISLAATATSGLPVTFVLISGPAELSGNTLTLTGDVGTVTVEARQLGNVDWNAATPVQQSFEATDTPPVTLAQFISFPKPPATFFLSQSPITLYATASSGLPVELIVISGPATLSSPSQLTFTGTGRVTVRATQPGGSGFLAAAPITHTFTVANDPARLTLTDLIQVYDGTERAVSVVGNTDSPVITYVINRVEVTTPPKDAGTYAVKAVADGRTVSGRLTILKAPLTVTPDSHRRFIGEANPPLTLTYSGFVPGDDEATVFAATGAKRPTITTTATPRSNGGTYPIRAAGGLLANYSFVYVNGVMTVESFAGRYEALLTDNTDTPAGKIEMTVAANSTAFSGKVSLPGELAPLSFTGTLSLDTLAEVATGITREFKKGANVYTIEFTIPLTAPFSADLALNAASIATTNAGKKIYIPARGDVIPAGAYTLILAPGQPSSPDSPAGYGYATATLDTKAVLKLAGRLADGTTLTATLMPAEDATFRLFVQPYRRLNSYVAGILPLEDHPNLTNRMWIPASSTVDLLWVKQAEPKDRAYRSGIGPLTTRATLDPWLRPDRTTSLASLLGLPGDGSFSVQHDAVDSAFASELPTDLQLDSKNKVLILAPITTPANRTKWAVAFNAANGLITGSYTLSDTLPGATRPTPRRVPFVGVLRQPHGTSTNSLMGAGHALIPALPGAASNEQTSTSIFFD